MMYPNKILEIPEDASQEEVRSAYMRKLREYPPEKLPLKFNQLQEAYDLVKDEVSRARLTIFGIPQKKSEISLPELLGDEKRMRNRIGINKWLDLKKR